MIADRWREACCEIEGELVELKVLRRTLMKQTYGKWIAKKRGKERAERDRASQGCISALLLALYHV